MSDPLTEGDIGDFTPAEEIAFLKRKVDMLFTENKQLKSELRTTRNNLQAREAFIKHLNHVLDIYREEHRGSKWHRILNILFP